MTTEPEFAYLAQLHALGDDPVPDVVQRLAGDDSPPSSGATSSAGSRSGSATGS